ncbi:MAG: efflux RND transporter periplasmic adaptor subunit [Bacteroidota bacterium]
METTKTDLSALKIDRSGSNYKSVYRRKQALRYSMIVLILAVLFSGGYYLWSSYVNKAEEVDLVTASLQVPSTSNAVLTASGYVVAQRQAAVASKGTGRLVYLGVVEGDQVRKNQIIARLEDSDIRAQLAEAKANLKLAEADYRDAEKYLNRQRALFKTGSAAEEALDAAEARFLKVQAGIEVAKAVVQAADVAMENTLIRAPFNGTVLTKNADVGEIVAPLSASTTSKAAVVNIADMSSLQVETDVSESNIQRIASGQDCEIILDAYPDRRYPGYVAKIVPTADRSKATVLVKVGFREYDSHVLPEMSAKVSFLTRGDNQTKIENEKPILLIPSSAIKERDSKKIVFVVRGEKIFESIITTGRQFGTDMEVVSGINPGEQIVDKPAEKLKDGTKIKL